MLQDVYDSLMRKFVNVSDDEDLLWEMVEDSLLEVAEDAVGGVWDEWTVSYPENGDGQILTSFMVTPVQRQQFILKYRKDLIMKTVKFIFLMMVCQMP